MPVFPPANVDQIQTKNLALSSGSVAIASYSSRFNNIRGIHNGSTLPTHRWTTFESPSERDWVQISFTQAKSVHTANVYFYSDGAGVSLPKAFTIQYMDKSGWMDVKLNRQVPESLLGNSLIIFSFKEVITAKKDFELVVIPGANHTSGGPYGEMKRRDFFVKSLMHLPAPQRNQMN